MMSCLFFFHCTARTSIYPLSLHDALPISSVMVEAIYHNHNSSSLTRNQSHSTNDYHMYERLLRSEEHTSELQSRGHIVCRLLLEKKKKNKIYTCKRTTAKECIAVKEKRTQ